MHCFVRKRKSQNTVVGYKKDSEFKIHIISENFGRQLYQSSRNKPPSGLDHRLI
eukprot:UN21745